MLIMRDVKVREVELPDVVVIRKVSLKVGESDVDLDEVERVNIGLESFIVMGRQAPMPKILPENNAGKLDVYENIRVLVNNVRN